MNVLNKENIFLDVEAPAQQAFFEFIAQKAVDAGYAGDTDAIVKGFFAREKLGSTGMKAGFAIPHVKHATVRNTAIMLAKLKTGIDAGQWETFDQKPVDIIIALFIPESGGSDDIKLLTSISAKLVRAEFQNELRSRNTRESLFEYLSSQISAK